MNSATRDARERLAVAGRIAREAGESILRHYGRTAHDTKDGGSPVTAADLEANEHIVTAIRKAWPGEAILAEESRDSRERLDADLVWLVDPLDGTREFLARNGEFSVMIGLVVSGVPILGVVYVPVRRLLYRAAAGDGAWAEEAGSVRRLRCAAPAPSALRMVGSRSHGDATIEAIRAALGVVEVRPSGSVGLKCALIAEGECDVYVHPVPYLSEWDTCAPEVILREAGGEVTDCVGERLGYNKAEPSQPHGIIACASEVHAQVLAGIRPLYDAAVARRAGAD
ncbi:MAG: 3'(2'),5'-bisphosphate nucleotidase CysQ [Gemmatimonadetes bacterium]|nr:3'(2'),5'-bisphosphate nucleotidase CysQ [Gemmatimonadota bacterium]